VLSNLSQNPNDVKQQAYQLYRRDMTSVQLNSLEKGYTALVSSGGGGISRRLHVGVPKNTPIWVNVPTTFVSQCLISPVDIARLLEKMVNDGVSLTPRDAHMPYMDRYVSNKLVCREGKDIFVINLKDDILNPYATSNAFELDGQVFASPLQYMYYICLVAFSRKPEYSYEEIRNRKTKSELNAVYGTFEKTYFYNHIAVSVRLGLAVKFEILNQQVLVRAANKVNMVDEFAAASDNDRCMWKFPAMVSRESSKIITMWADRVPESVLPIKIDVSVLLRDQEIVDWIYGRRLPHIIDILDWLSLYAGRQGATLFKADDKRTSVSTALKLFSNPCSVFDSNFVVVSPVPEIFYAWIRKLTEHAPERLAGLSDPELPHAYALWYHFSLVMYMAFSLRRGRNISYKSLIQGLQTNITLVTPANVINSVFGILSALNIFNQYFFDYFIVGNDALDFVARVLLVGSVFPDHDSFEVSFQTMVVEPAPAGMVDSIRQRMLSNYSVSSDTVINKFILFIQYILKYISVSKSAQAISLLRLRLYFYAPCHLSVGNQCPS